MPLLTLVGLVPLVGSVLVFAARGKGKAVGMAVALATLALGIYAYAQAAGGADLAEKHSWIAPIGAWYALSSDGLSMTMVLLTVILVPIVLLAEWRIGHGGRWGAGTFAGLALMLQSFALFCFMADDVLMFYLFFEATLIPMYFLIGGWGGERRGSAALKFLLYSLFGGLVMLFSVIGVGAISASRGTPSFLVSDLAALHLNGWTAVWLWLGFFIAFAVKAPMVPFHTWLPDTTEQANPGASTLLVGILDKIGTFGMLRFCLGIFPETSKWATPVVLVLALVSILYGALMAIGAKDLLRLVAYTSISHFGFMVMGIFAFTTTSISGSIFYMLNHGFSTAALFLVLGFLIRRRGSAKISAFGGVQKVAPVLAGFFLIAGLSALSLPGLGSFVGEFMVIAGTWSRHLVIAGIATLAIVLAALYVLLAYQRTMTGPVTDQVSEHITTDLTIRERAVMAILVGLLLLFGFFPKPAIDVINPFAKATMGILGMSDPAPKGGK